MDSFGRDSPARSLFQVRTINSTYLLHLKVFPLPPNPPLPAGTGGRKSKTTSVALLVSVHFSFSLPLQHSEALDNTDGVSRVTTDDGTYKIHVNVKNYKARDQSFVAIIS